MTEHDNRVAFYIPKGYSDEDSNFFVSINNTTYVLPRGKRVLVPNFVVAEICRVAHEWKDGDT